MRQLNYLKKPYLIYVYTVYDLCKLTYLLYKPSITPIDKDSMLQLTAQLSVTIWNGKQIYQFKLDQVSHQGDFHLFIFSTEFCHP